MIPAPTHPPGAPFIKTLGNAEQCASSSYTPHKTHKQLQPRMGSVLGEHRASSKSSSV